MSFTVAIFAATYLGMVFGRLPGFKVDRAGIAMAAAALLAVAGEVDPGTLASALHFPTLLLLAGLMVLSARFEAAGFYNVLVARISQHVARPIVLLALTVAVGGILSALLVNDIVVFAMTPLLCQGLRGRGLDPRPFLAGLAAASNAGAAATLIGAPQNILIGEVGGLDFWTFLVRCGPPALAALVVVFGVVALVWRRELSATPGPPVAMEVSHDRTQTVTATIAFFVLLVLFATPLPRAESALLVAAALMISRKVASRDTITAINLPLIVLFAGLFVVNDAFAATGLGADALAWLTAHGLLPDRIALLAPLSLVLGNTIGNVPAVMLILSQWRDVSSATLIGLALFSTLAGNLLLVGSLANLIVAERAAAFGVRFSFLDHARAGIPIAVLSMLLAATWLIAGGWMAL